MTVLENLEMGAYLRGGGGRRRTSSGSTTLFPLLYERRSQLAGTLSGGEQQMVAMGRALMSRPRLLLMDEPSMGLAPILVERNFEIIQQVHETGVAMLVVEQNANMSLSIADRGYVLSTGRIVLEGTAGAARERGSAQGVPRTMRVSASGDPAAASRVRASLETVTLAAGEPLESRLGRPTTRSSSSRSRMLGRPSRGPALLVLAGERETLKPPAAGRPCVRATIGPQVDRHAALGPRETSGRSGGGRCRERDREALVPDPVRPPQRVDPCDALRRSCPAGCSALALPPV